MVPMHSPRQGLTRFYPKANLTADERRRLVALEHRAPRLARILGVSEQTCYELVSPHGAVRPETLARVRQRLEELGA